jgi:hypothetical protein
MSHVPLTEIIKTQMDLHWWLWFGRAVAFDAAENHLTAWITAIVERAKLPTLIGGSAGAYPADTFVPVNIDDQIAAEGDFAVVVGLAGNRNGLAGKRRVDLSGDEMTRHVNAETLRVLFPTCARTSRGPALPGLVSLNQAFFLL